MKAWDILQFIIPMDIGEITEAKQKVIEEALNKNVEIRNMGSNKVLVLEELEENEALIIKSDGMTYINKVGSINSQSCLKNVAKMIKGLLIDGIEESHLKFVLLQDRENSMQKSKENFEKVHNIRNEKLSDVEGVGYRFIIDRKFGRGEIKVEPYIKKENTMFIGVTIEENATITDIVEYITCKVDMITNNYKELFEILM